MKVRKSMNDTKVNSKKRNDREQKSTTSPRKAAVPDYKADVEKMRRKAAELSSKKDQSGLVMADALIRGMRDIGYKNTAYAVFELIDNSIQAGAGKVGVELRSS